MGNLINYKMKLLRNLKLFVCVVLLSNCLSKTSLAKRTETGTMMAQHADSYLKCDNGDKSRWVKLDTESVKNERGSGIKYKMYYKNESKDCGSTHQYKTEGSKKYYFVPYRTFNPNDKPSHAENNVFLGRDKMRQLNVPRSKGKKMIFYFEDNLMITEEVSESELPTLKETLTDNFNNYMKNFRNYEIKLNQILISVRTKTENRKLKLNTKEELTSARDNKIAELEITKTTLKDLINKSEESKLKIRSLNKQQNEMMANEYNPLLKKIAHNKMMIINMRRHMKVIKDKIEGIKVVDEKVIADSKVKLRAQMQKLLATYLESDPKHAQLNTIIQKLDTDMGKIPGAIYN